MSVFAYTALSRDGKRTTGTLASESRAAALAQISRQGLVPVTIEESRDGKAAAKKVGAAPGGGSHGRVSAKVVENFTREMANLLAGGVPLARALSLLKREAHNPAARELWSAIHDDVIGGVPLAEALAKFPKNFSTVYVAMVRAGETGGFLDVVLGQIADFRLREADLKGKVKAAMIYPLILACVALAVLSFLLAWFIPKFSLIFTSFGAQLPALTRGILFASDLVRHYGLIVAAIGVAIFVLMKRALATETGKRRLERIILGTPVLGQVIAHFALVRFARMLGTLFGAGVPLIASLRVAREAIGNQTLSDTVSHAIEEVQRGTLLSKALSDTKSLFPSSVVEMIAVAEETARLDKELLRLATSYEADLDRQLRMLVAVAEPAMLFVIAGIIGTIVSGMLLPIFTLSDVVK
ncbi:MAG: type II secretion system F family protein [Tepidisphaeraceae bacterium]|jgi:type II secretory pathway component PulF